MPTGYRTGWCLCLVGSPWTETPCHVTCNTSWDRDPHPLWTEWHTGVKNITLPQTSFAGGNCIYFWSNFLLPHSRNKQMRSCWSTTGMRWRCWACSLPPRPDSSCWRSFSGPSPFRSSAPGAAENNGQRAKYRGVIRRRTDRYRKSLRTHRVRAEQSRIKKKDETLGGRLDENGTVSVHKTMPNATS